MSDIDEIEYSGSSKQESGSYHFSTEPPGTPPTITNDAAERRHRRSVSEQLFSVPTFSNFSSRAFHRGRHRKRTAVGKSEEEGDREEDVASFGEGTGGGSLGGFQTGWEYGGRSGLATYYSDFSPFDRNLDATNQQQSSAGRQGGGAHFKQALKRTVKKALTTSKQEDEGNAESSLNESSMLARDSRRRYKKASEDRKRHTRLTAYGAEHHDVKSKSDDEIPCDVPTILESDTDEQLPDHQRKQNRIRVSLADLFLKMKRSISMHSLDELQVIEKHTLRSDKLIGRAYVALNRGESVYTHEAPIRYFSVRKGDTRVLGTLSLDTSVESSLITSLDGSSLFGSLDEQERLSEEISAKTTTSTSKKSSLRRNLVRRFASHVHRHRFHRSKQRNQIQSSKETLCEHYIGHEGTFYFSPYEITRRFLETESAAPPPSVTWRPFFDWPGNRSLYLPMVPIQRRYPVRFWELRIPKLAWPIEFLLPMTRLAFPTANLVDSLDVKDTVKLTKIVESGLVNIFLVGARGLRSIPQVDMISGCGLDEKGGGGGNAMGNSFNGGDAATESLGAGGAALMGTSPETRAASLVALHWAAKSLTVSPSPQVVLSYGPEKRASSVVKNNSNPDFLEEFEFKLTNGAPRFIKIIVYDRETQTGTGGIPRNSILGETVIDLADMPIELTQKMEVQLLKNSNEARLLMFVTITGLNTAIRSPVQTPPSMISSPRSVISGNGSPTERDEKPSYPSLPMNYLHPLMDIHGIMKITVIETEKSKMEVIGGLAIHPLRLLQQRFEHVKPLLELIRWCGRVLDDWWLWKNPLHSILGLIGYQLLIYYFKPFFIPLYMVLVLLKNRIYNRGGVDSIIYGLKYNKTAAKLASPQEHEIYKRQYEMIEQYMVQGAYSRSQSWSPRENGNEGDDLDLFEQSSLTLDDDAVKKFSSAAKNKDDSDAPNLYNLTLPELSVSLNKFTKAILRPNSVRHNEFMDFLSRVPNLIDSVELAEYRPDAFTIAPKGKTHRS
ncbi:unnamed protein product [Mesocestoides corti]|uniref:C2 domain-containing protein n=1 Tax=Mesocestoides corti TaxID=53468 RepID=A0A0R3UGQ5_MESCO|nr:unnamed protein product [Mesocestoides corti]